MLLRLTIINLLLLFLLSVHGTDEGNKVYHIGRIDVAPQIDGSWNDDVWQNAPIATDFVQLRPIENARPSFRTEVKFAYDDGALYIAAYCYDDHPDSILTQLGNRDDNLNADFIRISIDPYDQQQDNTSFRLSASGVQGEWRLSDNSFNAVWESAVQIHEDGWLAEIKIPYSAIRFPKKEDQQWTMQIKRHIRRYKEDVIWSPIDRDDDNYMNYWGKLRGFKDIDPPVRLSITPFVTMQLGSKPDDDGNQEFDWLITGGADLKYGLNESFTLDMTLLPDFSQVQSDDIINNLSAFETVFDEQRAFFQEGTDLFEKQDLFYSRRIGASVLDEDAALDVVENDEGAELLDSPEKSRLLNAFKISGRTQKGAGIGIFNAIEGRSYAEIRDSEGNIKEVRTDPLTNYNIFVLERNFENNRSMYAINTNVTRTDDFDNANVVGAGFSFNSRNNDFNLRGRSAYSIINDKVDSTENKRGYDVQMDFDRITGKFRYGYRFKIVSDDFDNNDLGLNFRTNYIEHYATADYNVNDPFWKLLELYTSYRLSINQHLSTGEISDIQLRINMWGTFKKSYISMWVGSNIGPYGTKDYYEARTDGQVFRDVKYGNIFFGMNTDYRKRLAIEMEMWHSMSREYGGIYHFGYWFEPYYRVNDHLTLTYYFNVTKRNNDIGFADFDIDDLPIFGKRNRIDYTNRFTANYIFKNNLSLGVRIRHYWSRVDYSKYFGLDDAGYLIPTYYTDLDEDNNNNFNSFNVDLLFNWEFAPGSSLSVSYKNEIFASNDNLDDPLFDNLSSLFDEAQSNVVSIRLLYYLDYVTVRSWLQKSKAKKGKAYHPRSIHGRYI